jgi:hypothetical protein
VRSSVASSATSPAKSTPTSPNPRRTLPHSNFQQPLDKHRSIERFHRTLKLWLTAQPDPATIGGLQQQLDAFATLYNTQRPHRALHGGATPAQAYTALPKAAPASTAIGTFRIRHDRVDQFGKLTLRHGSRLHHLGIGRVHAHTQALILVTDQHVLVLRDTDHQLIASHHIDPDRNYWRNQQKNPGRWPG